MPLERNGRRSPLKPLPPRRIHPAPEEENNPARHLEISPAAQPSLDGFTRVRSDPGSSAWSCRDRVVAWRMDNQESCLQLQCRDISAEVRIFSLPSSSHFRTIPSSPPPSPHLPPRRPSGLILVEHQPPQGVLVCDDAGLVIKKF